MGDFCVHHVKFFNYLPSGIVCLAYNRTDHLLAVGREDNSIEIWDIGERCRCHQQNIIPGSEKRKVNSLTWVKGRLFSSGLQGDITEYDLQRLAPKKSVYYGNAFWCMAANNAQTHLAAGCEDGYIRIYEIADEGVTFDRTLQMQQGRVVSLAWHESDEIIVTGSLDNIRIWDVHTGHATHRITVQRMHKQHEIVVWCVGVLRDMTIVSGDSAGRTQFWNGKHGTLLKSYTSHRATILTVCVSDDQNTVFSAGVDPTIAEFQLVVKGADSDAKHWVRSRVIRDHTHDVRALVMAKDRVISGGVDTMLVMNSSILEVDRYKRRQSVGGLRIKLHAFPHKPLVTMAAKAKLLLFQFPYSLEVWRLGNTQASSDKDGKTLPLSEHPVKLLELKTKGTEQIVCSTLSSCGSWLAYSDVDKMRFYHITYSPVSINRVPTIPSSVQPAHHMTFTSDSAKLVLATKEGGLQVLTVEGPDGVDCPQPLVQNIPTGGGVRGPVGSMAVSDDGKRAALVDGAGKVTVVMLSVSKNKRVVLPSGRTRPCCLAFNPETSTQLAIAYTDRNIVEYDVEKQEYTPWSKRCNKEGMHHGWLDKNEIIQQLTYDPTNSDRLLLHDGLYLTVIDKSKPLPARRDRLFGPRLGKRRHEESVSAKQRTHGFAICQKYKSVMFFGALADPGWLVVVERPPQAILEQLPAVLQGKKFGT